MNTFHRTVAAAIVAVLALPAFAAPRQTPTVAAPPTFVPKYLEQIPLRFADAATLAKTLNAQPLPKGVTRITVATDDAKALQVLGTADGVAELKAMVALVDVEAKKATFKVIVERNQFAPNGVRYANPVTTKTLTLIANKESRFVFTDSNGDTIAAAITARIPNGDTPPTLFATLGWMNKKEYTVGLERFMPLPTAKKTVGVVGITFSDDPDMIATLGVGKIPTKWTGRHTAYILYVKPVTEPK